MENLNEVLIEQLKDLYSAEEQLIEALPKMAQGAVSPELRKGIEQHLKETKNQFKRLEKAGDILEEDLSGHPCKAMKGLIKEGNEVLEEDYEDEALRDVMLVAAAQRIEHYEIAGYGNAIALADYLGYSDLVDLLKATIREEGETDKKLTSLCENKLFDNCESGEEEGEEEDIVANL